MLIQLLERRLDAVVYRAKFVPTVFAARQFVNHGHILVNGKRVNIPSYQVRDGDVVQIKEKSPRAAAGARCHRFRPSAIVPDYIDLNLKDMSATYVRGPAFADVPYPVQMEPHLVVEFYSR